MLLNDVIVLANNLFEQYNIKDWSFKFDRSIRRYGQCRYSKKEIGLSKQVALINNKDTIKNIILHEIAHALVGPNNSHNIVWQQKCIELGCPPTKTLSTVKSPNPEYVAICKHCGTKFVHYRQPRTNKSCGKCCSTFNKKYILHFHHI